MKLTPRSLWLAAPALMALSLLASCTEKPKETDASKTAVLVPADAGTAADSAAAKSDSAK